MHEAKAQQSLYEPAPVPASMTQEGRPKDLILQCLTDSHCSTCEHALCETACEAEVSGGRRLSDGRPAAGAGRVDAIAQTEAASHRANSEQEEALIAKLRRAPAPLGLKFDDSPAPKEDRSPHDFAHELADSQRPASAGSVEQPRQRPASASSGDDKLREYKAVDGDESSIWLPDGAQRRQRRQYQDVVTHEKTLADRVIDKNARIDELVKENKAREEELEAASTKLQRPASASSGDEPLREYKVVENGVQVAASQHVCKSLANASVQVPASSVRSQVAPAQ